MFIASNRKHLEQFAEPLLNGRKLCSVCGCGRADEESEYITFLYTGSDADSLMDADAKEIFLNNADLYYTDSSLSDEAYFAKIFRESLDEIMGK